jgi:hypothetical protein
MVHWVMIDMAKLSKEKRERIERLLSQGLCCDCEKGKAHSRWDCQTCLDKLYAIQKYGDPIEAVKYEQAKIRQGKMAPRYDKTYSHLKVKKPKRVAKAG